MQSKSTQYLSVDLLQANPFQPREKLKTDELEELMESIKVHGVLEPLVVAHTPAGYQIIAGERRWRAAKMAHLDQVPVVITKTTPKGMLEMAIVENLQRTDLTPIERAQSFQRLMRNFHIGVNEVAERIGKSHSYVSNSIRLLSLPDAIKDGLLGHQITEGHARAIAQVQDQKLMIKVYKQVLKENASVRRAEDIARNAKRKSNQNNFKSIPKKYFVDDEVVKQFATKVKKYISKKTILKLRRTEKQTKISFIIKGDLETTQPALEKIIGMVEDLARKEKKGEEVEKMLQETKKN